MTYRVIAGAVNRLGTIRLPAPPLQPEFRVIKNSAEIGIYTIVFEPPFSQLVAGSSTQIFQVSHQSLLDNSYIMSMDQEKAKICTGNSLGNFDNRDFTFIFVGVGRS